MQVYVVIDIDPWEPSENLAGVFSTLEAAEQCLRGLIMWDHSHIEVFELDAQPRTYVDPRRSGELVADHEDRWRLR